MGDEVFDAIAAGLAYLALALGLVALFFELRSRKDNRHETP